MCLMTFRSIESSRNGIGISRHDERRIAQTDIVLGCVILVDMVLLRIDVIFAYRCKSIEWERRGYSSFEVISISVHRCEIIKRNSHIVSRVATNTANHKFGVIGSYSIARKPDRSSRSNRFYTIHRNSDQTVDERDLLITTGFLVPQSNMLYLLYNWSRILERIHEHASNVDTTTSSCFFSRHAE